MFKRINFLSKNAAILLFVTLNYYTLFLTPLPPIIWGSFFLNLHLLIIVLYYHLYKEKDFSPAITTSIVFFTLFFFIAPVIQVSSVIETGLRLNNYLPFSHNQVIKANGLIFVFLAVLYVSYYFIKIKKSAIKYVEPTNKRLIPIVFLLLTIISALVVVLNFETIITDIESSNYSNKISFDFNALILKKFVFFIPLGGVVLLADYLKKSSRLNTNKILAYFFLVGVVFLLFFLKNPLTEKRNALGPIYFTLIYIFIPKLINSNKKFFLFLFTAMIVVYPVLSSLTHSTANFSQILKNPDVLIVFVQNLESIKEVFDSLHYDAYINLLATIEYVSTEGFFFGGQVIGTLFFFIPRAFWTSKPLSSGELIGNYLMERHDFFFNNLSNPIVSEGYIDFGIIGVIMYAFILSYFMLTSKMWIQGRDPFRNITAFYFSVHLMFLIRGDLLNGVAYFLGPFIAIYVLPKFLIFLFKK